MASLHTLTLEDLRDQSLEKFFCSVLTLKETLTVKMPGGGEVVVRPKPQLEPLPVLDGSVPEGWKDAIYDEGH